MKSNVTHQAMPGFASSKHGNSGTVMGLQGNHHVGDPVLCGLACMGVEGVSPAQHASTRGDSVSFSTPNPPGCSILPHELAKHMDCSDLRAGHRASILPVMTPALTAGCWQRG